MITDVVDVAWAAIGSPMVISASVGRGTCARCGREADLAPSNEAVSKFYRAWDSWIDPNGPGVCPACLWSFRTPLLRGVPHGIHRDPAMLTPLSPAALTTHLARGLGGDETVLLPLRPGRRHLIHLALWGTITTDHGPLPWSEADADRLRVYHHMLHLGFRAADMHQPMPAWSALSKLTNSQVSDVLEAWHVLEPWRTNPAWLHIASRTQPSSQGAPA